MSFRTRLTSFFLLIVVLPMLAVGVLVFRLIADSEQGKADARASGLATVATSLYGTERSSARADALAIARNLRLLSGPGLRANVSSLAVRAGLVRIAVQADSRTIADVGDRSAVAPGVATVASQHGAPSVSVLVSEVTAARYAQSLTSRGAGVVVRQGSQSLASTLTATPVHALPRRGEVRLGGARYSAVTESFSGFGGAPLTVTVLSSLSATDASAASSRALAAAFIAGFLLLAFSFSGVASRGLQRQVSRFLEAARRLRGGDFSARIPTEGQDEFAALGEEFNNMSTQLAGRLDELSAERARLREVIHRIGQTFASNLDRRALLGLALKTAVDAVDADCGRLSVKSDPDGPLEEAVREGSLTGAEDAAGEAERTAWRTGQLAEVGAEHISVASVRLGPLEREGVTHGVITVTRRGRSFSEDDREVLRSLATQSALALENVELHFQVRRQAVTDELTGLANHGRFYEMFINASEQVRRYQHPLGLIMLDLDNFKSINDTYGHLQGDVVLERVAGVLRESSRDADVPARYGGEELALILPHTDLEGSYAIAERIRTAIGALRIPIAGQQGFVRVTASLGVAASTNGDTDRLIAEADAALYRAKRQGKNRTVSAALGAAKAVGGG